MQGLIPEKTKGDWKAAGRCLAFSLLTASGFHVVRAVEGTLEAYYQAFCAKPGATKKGWSDYIEDIQKIPATASNIPSNRTLVQLDQMRVDWRNPIAHPRVTLTEVDARMLFNNGESLIIGMAQELQLAQEANTHPSLALVAPAAGVQP